MNDKLNIKNKDAVIGILEEILEVHNSDILDDILDGLLRKYNHDLLIDKIKNKAHKKNRKRQDFFSIGLDVYTYKYNEECSMTEAKSFISEKVGIKVKTIESHLEAFRKDIRANLKNYDVNGHYGQSIKQVEKFIIDLIEDLHQKYSRSNPKRKKAIYKERYKRLLQNLDKQYAEYLARIESEKYLP